MRVTHFFEGDVQWNDRFAVDKGGATFSLRGSRHDIFDDFTLSVDGTIVFGGVMVLVGA